MLPICPICKKELMIPFSASQYEAGAKIFGTWICSKCGFYMTTGDTRGVDPESDIKIGINSDLKIRISEMREKHLKKNPE